MKDHERRKRQRKKVSRTLRKQYSSRFRVHISFLQTSVHIKVCNVYLLGLEMRFMFKASSTRYQIKVPKITLFTAGQVTETQSSEGLKYRILKQKIL